MLLRWCAEKMGSRSSCGSGPHKNVKQWPNLFQKSPIMGHDFGVRGGTSSRLSCQLSPPAGGGR